MADFGSALWNKPASVGGGGSEEGSGAPSDPVTRSLRFKDADNSHLYFDPTATHDSTTVYTFSCWAKLGEMSAESYEIFTAGYYTSGSSQDLIYFGHNADSKMRVWLRSTHDSTNTTYTSTAVFRDPAAWYHLTLVRNGASLKVYVNNTEVISETISSTQRYGVGNGYAMHVGSSVKPTSSSVSSYASFDGLLADIYFTDGHAKVPTDFIEDAGYGAYKPKAYTGEFGTNGFHLDAQPAHDADLLVSSVSRNDGDTTFADVAVGHTVSRYGHTEHSIAVGNPFTGDDRAIYFDGADDYLQTSTSSDLTFGTGDFTVELWFNPATVNTSAGYKGIISDELYSDTGGWALSQRDDELSLWIKNTGGSWVSFVADGALTAKWQHVAVSYDSSTTTTRLFVDGTVVASGTTSGWNLTGDQVEIGRSVSGQEIAGYLFDVRVTKGQARYTSSFTSPTSKLTADSNTKLLIQPDKDDTGFHDLSDSDHTVTATSTPTITASTPYDAAAKSTAIYFDGTGDYLDTPDSTDFTLGSGDFTYEFWVNFGSIPSSGDMSVLGQANSSGADTSTAIGFKYTNTAGGAGWAFYDTANSISYHPNWSGTTGSQRASGATSVSANTWYHFAIVRSGDTVDMYKDGVSYSSITLDSSSVSLVDSSNKMALGRFGEYDGQYLQGYLYDVRLSKGTARYTSNFTKPSASFELNPVYIGGDQSGNKNHFTVSGISITHDVMLDNPFKNYCLINPLAETKTDSSSYDANPTTGLSEGNLKLTSSGNFFNGHGTLGVSSGKWYFEWYSTGDWVQGGFTTREMFSNYSQSLTDFWVLYNRDSTSNIAVQYKDGTGSANAGWAGGGHASGNGNVFGCAFDVDNRKMYFHKNGEWSDGTSTLTSTFPSSYGGDLTGSSHNIPADTTFYPTVRPWTSSTVIANFGQDSTFANTVSSGSANAADANGNGDFRYTPPSSYLALCTASLSAPSVTPSDHFNTVLYTGSYDSYHGTGTATQSITGVGFSPDIVWIKDRDNLSNDEIGGSYSGHYWFDTVLGTGSPVNIDQEQYLTSGSLNSGEDGLTSFDSDGFSIDDAEETNAALDSSWNGGNPDTFERYVAWCWKLGTTASSWSGGGQDPDSEQYNSDAGVSIINYTDGDGNGTSITLNHSLGYAPEFAIWLDYDGYYNQNFSWHKDLAANSFLDLSGNAAQASDSTFFPSGPATNTTFEVGSAIADSQQSHVALFRSVEGYSKFGSYVGNLSVDGTFIYTGFRPRFIMIKNIQDSGHAWYIHDTARSPNNYSDLELTANSSGEEYSVMTAASVERMDINSNGFKLRGNNVATNANGKTHIYAAWAEVPFARANAR